MWQLHLFAFLAHFYTLQVTPSIHFTPVFLPQCVPSTWRSSAHKKPRNANFRRKSRDPPARAHPLFDPLSYVCPNKSCIAAGETVGETTSNILFSAQMPSFLCHQHTGFVFQLIQYSKVGSCFGWCGLQRRYEWIVIAVNSPAFSFSNATAFARYVGVQGVAAGHLSIGSVVVPLAARGGRHKYILPFCLLPYFILFVSWNGHVSNVRH